MRFDCSANAGRKPSPSVRLMMAGSGPLDSGRTRSASVTPSAAGISRVCSIMLGGVGVPGPARLSRAEVIFTTYQPYLGLLEYTNGKGFPRTHTLLKLRYRVD